MSVLLFVLVYTICGVIFGLFVHCFILAEDASDTDDDAYDDDDDVDDDDESCLGLVFFEGVFWPLFCIVMPIYIAIRCGILDKFITSLRRERDRFVRFLQKHIISHYKDDGE